MPIALVYLGIMLAVILIWFLVFKRPVYESIFLSFLVLVAVSGTWANIPKYINSAMKTSLMFTMFAFVAMAQLLGKTKVIDSCIQVILALFGRVPGGAGYVSIIGSSFMGALSGSGPGNVMATGVFTIPPMIRSGYPRHLAANVESNASYLGNMIPPSSNIVAALGAYTALFPEENMSSGDFWICMWGVSLWFIILKLVMLFCFCKYYKVTAMQPEDIPNLKESIKNGWKGLLLPVIIFVPFMLDSVAKETFIAARLGAGKSNFSSSLLLVVPGVAALYSMAICPDKSFWNPVKLAAAFSGGLKSLCGTISPCLFGYMVGALFTDLGVAEGLQSFLTGMTFGKFAMVVFIVIMTCFMGMIIPGSSMVVMFGQVFITVLAGVGCDPLLVAAMLPCICGVMCGITPPLALGMYAGMAIAESEFGPTVKNDLIWCAGQFVMEVVVLMGVLPVIGI